MINTTDRDLASNEYPEHEWTNLLENNYETILNEYINFMKEYPSYIYENGVQVNKLYPNNDFLNRELKWSVITLRCYGIDTTISKTYFKQTMDIISECDKHNYLPHIMFSILRPRKSIRLHRGYYSGILRYQLSISVPKHDENDLYLRIHPNTSRFSNEDKTLRSLFQNGGIDEYKIVKWKNGTDFIFDDTNWHSVVNKINQTRTSLLMDVERNDLPFWQMIINKMVIHSIKYVFPLCHQVNDRQNDVLKTCNLKD